MRKINDKQVGFVYKATLPDEYQQVEYIESTKASSGIYGLQYINTGYIPSSSGFKVNVVFNQSSTNNNTGCFVYGAYDSTNGYKPSLYVYAQTRKLGVYFNASSNKNTNIVCELDTDYDVTITTSGARVDYNINGSTGNITTTYNQLSNNTPIVLFTSYVGNAYLLRTKIKMVKIYDENNVLVRNMVPCYRKSDNVIGMYDKANGVFYLNNGSSVFEKGNSKNVIDNIDKIYKGNDLIFEQGFDREQQGEPPIETTKKTIGKDLKDYKIYGNSIQDGTPSLTNRIEVENVGDLVTDTSDENYGKYKIPIIISGKNLLPYPYPSSSQNNLTFSSANGKLLINGTPNATFWKTIYTFDLPAGKYTFVETNNIGAVSGHSVQLSIGGTSILNVTVESSRANNITLDSNSTVSLNFRFTSGNKIDNEELSLMIIPRNATTDFEQYIAPSTSAIYLTEPLRKIGDYADYIDFKNQKVIRNLREHTIQGNEAWGDRYAPTILCNIFISQPTYTIKTSQKIYIDITTNGGTYGFRTTNTTGNSVGFDNAYAYFGVSDLTEFKAKLAEIKPKFTYVLANPMEESITLPILPTKKGTTVYIINTSLNPSNMYIKYKGK